MDFQTLKTLTIPEGEVKQIACGDVVLWKSGFTNLVPLSINTDGSIYQNGKGYIEGRRLSSIGNLSSSEQGNTATTGFIKATKSDVVRMAGTKWTQTAGYNYFVMYDKNFNVVETINFDGSGNASTKGWSYSHHGKLDSNNTYVYVENGVTRFAPAFKYGSTDYAYIRISAYGSGADMIVTVNEEIT